MTMITPSVATVNPSFMEPGTILPYAQASGAFELLADGQPQAKLSEGDLYVYIKKLDIRTRMAAGQSAMNQLPGISTKLEVISTPTYIMRVRAEYDHHDTAAAARWGLSIADVNRHGMRQGHFQLARSALLFGFNSANGEGLLNANGATAIPLPPDTFGNTGVASYDNGQMAIFLLTQISALKSRTNQLGISRKIVIIGPQRVLSAFEYQNIVQLTSYQREGGGTASTANMIKDVAEGNGDTIVWGYDDTLQGKGLGGTDAIVIVMPEVELQKKAGINTNEFAKVTPGFDKNSVMYCDMAAPREIPTPLPAGAIDIVSEWRISSGWAVRPECVTIVSMPLQ